MNDTFGKLLLYENYVGLSQSSFCPWHVSSTLQELEIKFHHISCCPYLVFSKVIPVGTVQTVLSHVLL